MCLLLLLRLDSCLLGSCQLSHAARQADSQRGALCLLLLWRLWQRRHAQAAAPLASRGCRGEAAAPHGHRGKGGIQPSWLRLKRLQLCSPQAEPGGRNSDRRKMLRRRSCLPRCWLHLRQLSRRGCLLCLPTPLLQLLSCCRQLRLCRRLLGPHAIQLLLLAGWVVVWHHGGGI